MLHDVINIGGFGKYPKTRYTLFINKKSAYSFVTTIHPEEECIERLKEIAQTKYSLDKMYFHIEKHQNGVSTMIYKGKKNSS